ncbi:hypothetical protein J6590_001601 [Homalodisca vitripennis]|nr:hypothetical protein J6590_001601 [Homalodisca vitripennis]
MKPRANKPRTGVGVTENASEVTEMRAILCCAVGEGSSEHWPHPHEIQPNFVRLYVLGKLNDELGPTFTGFMQNGKDQCCAVTAERTEQLRRPYIGVAFDYVNVATSEAPGETSFNFSHSRPALMLMLFLLLKCTEQITVEMSATGETLHSFSSCARFFYTYNLRICDLCRNSL